MKDLIFYRNLEVGVRGFTVNIELPFVRFFGSLFFSSFQMLQFLSAIPWRGYILSPEMGLEDSK